MKLKTIKKYFYSDKIFEFVQKKNKNQQNKNVELKHFICNKKYFPTNLNV